MSKKILILGASGQLGQQLLKRAPSSYELDAPSRDTLDISNEARVAQYLRATRPDVIINAAAYTAVEHCEQQQTQAAAVNTLGAQWVAIYAQQIGARLLHLSTDYVFDGRATQPYEVNAPCAPVNHYGYTKWAAEQAVQAAMPSAVIMRTSWLYSESGHNFLKTIVTAAQTQPELKVVNDQKGSPTYAGHLAEALFALIGQIVAGGVYHFAGATAMTWHQFAQYVLAEAAVVDEAYAATTVTPISSSQLAQRVLRPAYSVLSTVSLEDKGIAPSCFRAGVRASLSALVP